MKKSLGAKTLAYPTPVWVVGSYDSEGKPNIMTVAWGGICCSQPPCVTVSLRKATYSYGNIMARKAYTVSIPSVRYLREADYVGIYSGRHEDKFAETGLTAVAQRRGGCPLRAGVSHGAGVSTAAGGRVGAAHAVYWGDC